MRHLSLVTKRQPTSRSLSEGRFDGQFVSYLKQSSREVSPQEEEEEEGERVVLSPTSLLLSPSSTPLDLTTKKRGEVQPLEVVEVEERPTDYSLRYQESEEPELSPAKSQKQGEETEELPRTYCTEGTPMDTPFAFSTATSMSDLRVAAIQEEEEEVEQEEKEVTVQYAVEGTPLAFSRAESLSDLEELEGPGEGAKLQAIPETTGEPAGGYQEKGMAETEGEKEQEAGGSKTPVPREKTVTFRPDDEVQLAPQETPMMFSRASSVASLDSFDAEGSLQDGYSSYDASRATSGRVSPSDLPDSPSQTMPTSPRTSRGAPARPPAGRPLGSQPPPLAPQSHKSIYADVVTSYQEEVTSSLSWSPLNFSNSSLCDILSYLSSPPGHPCCLLHPHLPLRPRLR